VLKNNISSCCDLDLWPHNPTDSSTSPTALKL